MIDGGVRNFCAECAVSLSELCLGHSREVRAEVTRLRAQLLEQDERVAALEGRALELERLLEAARLRVGEEE